MSRRVRKANDSPRSKQGYTSSREVDTASRRSTRAGDTMRNSTADKKEPYCVSYFRENPDSMDMRTPSEKLQEIQDKMESEDLEPAEKFKLLSQIKTIQYMLHGENSSEMLKAYAQLGFFYNDNDRPQSAIRNLDKAHNLERTNSIEKNDSITIAVETARAHLKMAATQGTKHIMQADDALSPYYEIEIDQPELLYKRNLFRSRIFAGKKKYEEALKSYEDAVTVNREINNNEETKEEAQLFIEMGQTAELLKKKLDGKSQEKTQEEKDKISQTKKLAIQYYQKAYDIFMNLEFEEYAKEIEPKLHDDEYEYYDEEEEEKNETYQPHPPEEGDPSGSRRFKSKLLDEQQAIIGALTGSNPEEEEKNEEEVQEKVQEEKAKDEEEEEEHKENEEEEHKENEEEEHKENEEAN